MIDPAELQAHPERFLQVCAERCDECLFSKRALVARREVKRKIDSAIAEDTHFICHKHTIRAVESDGAITHRQANVCCRAYYDVIGDRVLVIRLARMLGIVVFVDSTGMPVEERGDHAES